MNPFEFNDALKALGLGRVWPKVNRSESCWTWSGEKKAGLAVLQHKGEECKVVHILYGALHNKHVRGGLVQACKSKGCVNPEHYEERPLEPGQRRYL